MIMEGTSDRDDGPSSVPDTAASSTQQLHTNLKIPSELGVETTTLGEDLPQSSKNSNTLKGLRKENYSRGQQRAVKAIQSMQSPAVAAAAANVSFDDVAPSMICTISYKGMEMLFCAVEDEVGQTTVVGVCARTRVTLQYLDIPPATAVTLLKANPASGMVIIGLSNETIQTYHPTPTSATLSSSSPEFLKSAFGRYRWINGPVADCRPIFSLPSEGFVDHNFATSANVSSSADFKLLVTHRDQLAIFSVPPNDFRLSEAEVVWITRIQCNIFVSRISGDGQSIVYLVENEGLEHDSPFGARTFLRDMEDGAPSRRNSNVTPGVKIQEGQCVPTESIGIVYTPGPFLVHTAAVTHLSFRGFGHLTSSVTAEQDEGNDLLLTYCNGDNAVRIFSQNSWKQLIHWNTPPQTSVDWVRGVSAFNLGDLEPNKCATKGGVPSQRPSRKQSLTSGESDTAKNTSSQATIGAHTFQQLPPTRPTPSTSAGAWITEITFHSAFPALRLSRLTYLKRSNDDAQPAHFESVSAILPAGSIIADGVLQMGETGLSVQGIWPAWHPWTNSDGREDSKLDSGTLSGSAMQFLGLSAGNLATNGFFGENGQGGTHGPPSELRVISSHPKTGNVILMEFPLWGDNEFGAVELGSPLRYLLSLSDIAGIASQAKDGVACLDYESDKLCARLEKGGKAVSITWRKQGSQTLLPSVDLFAAILPNNASFEQPNSKTCQFYSDWSVLPVPLSLPSLKLPSGVCGKDETILDVQWWPDENYGGPPQLLSICSSGTLLVFEIPPPWSALEPAMPSHDPFFASSTNSSLDGKLDADSVLEHSDSESYDSLVERQEYDVMVNPHAEFGIGLRLESQCDGMPAIAGSFKKHPLNGGKLPAEKTGMIMLGDELLRVNGISLKDMTFDDVISTVRQVGADASPGSPLCMQFRPATTNRLRASSVSFSTVDNSDTSQAARRSREKIFGMSPKSSQSKTAATTNPKPQNIINEATGEVGETQQKFARIIGVVNGAMPDLYISASQDDVKSQFLLLPWTCDWPLSHLRCAALLIIVEGKALRAKCVELALNCAPKKAKCVDLGHFELADDIKSIQRVNTTSERWCISVSHGKAENSLIFISLTENTEVGEMPATWEASFEHFPILVQRSADCLVRAFSSQLLGTMETSNLVSSEVHIWTAIFEPRADEGTAADVVFKKKQNTHLYFKFVLSLSQAFLKNDTIVDFRFVSSGSMNGTPWMVLLTNTVAVVHAKLGGKAWWLPILTIEYPSIPRSTPNAPRLPFNNRNQLSPLDSIPHLAYAIRSLVESADDISYIRCDWHPDAVLTDVCTDNEGPLHALLQNVEGIYQWLSQWTQPDIAKCPTFNHLSRIGVTPFRERNGHSMMTSYVDGERSDKSKVSDALSLMTAENEVLVKNELSVVALTELQNVLCPSQTWSLERGKILLNGTRIENAERSEYKLPQPLQNLNCDEIRLLWAIGEILSAPPLFESLDAPAQHVVFCATLCTQLKAAKNDEEREDSIKREYAKSARSAVPTNSSPYFSRRQSFILKDSASKTSEPAIAVSSGIAALTSKTQNALIKKCRPAGKKFDWLVARSLRLPFWVRSDDELRRLCVEIGQSIFQNTRDIMECAIFFIIAGNMRTLKNLAATDHKESGKKYMKFLSSYDFASPQGRQAAEKNAYSLLRKNRYNVAASFFLLAKPPMLNTAIETLVSKSGDLDLAFLATRLMEAIDDNQNESPFGRTLSFKAIGGGGGYAGGGMQVQDGTSEMPYEVWEPKIGKASKQLLRSRLELAETDCCFRALQLVWLSRREEAARELSETGGASFPQSFDTYAQIEPDDLQPEHNSYPFHAPVPKSAESANYRVVRKANDVINFVSRPFLLKALHSSVSSRWAGTLQICQSLSERGIELPAARCLLQYTNERDYDEYSATKASKEKKDAEEAFLDNASSTASKLKVECAETQTTSSIFDAFSSHPRLFPTSNITATIFDDDEASPQDCKDRFHSQQSQPASTIFDDFSTAPQKRMVQKQSQSSQNSSSIFDDFDVAPQTCNREARSQSSTIASSIFDEIDTGPRNRKEQQKPVHSQAGGISSSIFDGFDTAPQIPHSPTRSQYENTKSASRDHVVQNYFATQTPSPANTTPLTNVNIPNLSKGTINAAEKDETDPELPSLPPPLLWMKWRNGILAETVARRVLRELGQLIDLFDADTTTASMSAPHSSGNSVIASSATDILRTSCDGKRIMLNVTSCLQDLCCSFDLKPSVVVQQALRILNINAQPRRIVLSTLLYTAADRTDLAEDVIRDSAIAQMQRCNAFTSSFDDLVDNRKTIHHTGSQHLRRLAVRVSWQLELCLWLYRGGVISLSGTVLKEAIMAVRVGFVIASWGSNHECLDAIVRNDPDSPLDPHAGRQLWSSTKMIAGLEDKSKKRSTHGSGGWEFLVDCQREEATFMLRKRPPGSFIIRPHPEDNGVFTLSFKTNLTPVNDKQEVPFEMSLVFSEDKTTPLRPPAAKPVKKDDVVQHAIIRLSDAGFRCGSFGPFTSLLKLLEAVSASLPFDLRFDKPPTEGIIKEEDHQPTPNAVFLRKFSLLSPLDRISLQGDAVTQEKTMSNLSATDRAMESREYAQLRQFGAFSQLLTLSEIRKQLSAVASADYEELLEIGPSWNDALCMDANSVQGLLDDSPAILGIEERYAIASRLVRPLLTWCQSMEIQSIYLVAPPLNEVSLEVQKQPCALAFTESAIELAPHKDSGVLDGGDTMIRRMIQPESGVEFRTLRVGEGGDSAMIVLFSRSEAISWVKSSGMEKTNKDALHRLMRMEKRRVIEPIALSDLNLKAFSSHSIHSESNEDVICYRFVDPWEVEVLDNREGETKAAALGREHYLAFSINAVATSCESTFRKLGGLHLLGLWSNEKGGLRLTKAVASVHPPWERDAGGDLQMSQGSTVEPTPFENAIRRHLYRNSLYRRLEMPQRFLVLVQVELLDLKNLNAPGGTSLSVYALLRLKRSGSSAPLTHKARTLDSAATNPMKIGKCSGPNAPASWGTLVRFRFPLPEDVNCDGISYDEDREALFKGPPCMLQLSVYEKKFMSDIALGGADVKLDALTSGGQMEEWVPLRSQKHGINWFARIRLTLRFELMCIPYDVDAEMPSSVGLSKIQQLSKLGGTHEEKVKKSASTPDILSYFESMVY